MTPGARLMTLADELRAIASNGHHWPTNEHDRARYDRTLAIAAQLASLADTRTAGEIERVFRGNLGMRTPVLSVDAAVFDESGRLLLDVVRRVRRDQDAVREREPSDPERAQKVLEH
jgi:hypothetical protein